MPIRRQLIGKNNVVKGCKLCAIFMGSRFKGSGFKGSPVEFTPLFYSKNRFIGLIGSISFIGYLKIII